MTTNALRYFVWVNGTKGPEPQKWVELDFGVGEWMTKSGKVICYVPITPSEAGLSLDELAGLYPVQISEKR
jgi:hypothetical protein